MTTILGVSCNSNNEKVMIISTIPRFTYRRGFRALKNETHYIPLRSDTHWGCCIRCGQSMIAQFLKKSIENYPDHFNAKFPESNCFLNLFNDLPDAPFSIHSFCNEITKIGGHEGKWVTLSKLSLAIKNMLQPYEFPVYICQNSSLIKSEIVPMFKGDKMVLCLIPILCGLKKFDMKCYGMVGLSVSLSSGIGFISGVKNKAYYYVGVSKEQFFYFDPHKTKSCVTGNKDQRSYFEPKLKAMEIEDISPSLMLGFAWRNVEDMEECLGILSQLEFIPISIMESIDDIKHDILMVEEFGDSDSDRQEDNDTSKKKINEHESIDSSWEIVESTVCPASVHHLADIPFEMSNSSEDIGDDLMITEQPFLPPDAFSPVVSDTVSFDNNDGKD